jgi:hypothetical protein
VAVFAAGFGFGWSVGILVLAPVNPMVALLGGGLLGVLGGVLAVKLQRVFIILSTAVLGALRALLALTYFTRQIDWLFYFQQPQQFPAFVAGNPWIFPATLGLAAAGVIVQFGIGTGGAPKKAKAASE